MVQTSTNLTPALKEAELKLDFPACRDFSVSTGPGVWYNTITAGNEGKREYIDKTTSVYISKERKIMNISEILLKMIHYSKGNLHDINHFMKVYGYAKTIAECEKIPPDKQQTTEIAAIIHDIACPLCRKKYGNTNGIYQEREGEILAREFLQDTGLPDEVIERAAFLVAHHHTPKDVDGIDYQILLEADYLVNADESDYPKEHIEHTLNSMFRTSAGIELLKAVYSLRLSQNPENEQYD